MGNLKELIDKLENKRILSLEEFIELLSNFTEETSNYLFEKARNTSKKYFGNKIYTRGLIEFTNYCKNDCFYCGIRRSNVDVERYRLSKEDILNCCENGYELGFRTFVLQGGEDLHYSDDYIVEIVSEIKKRFPDTAITLSIGEKSYESYEKYYKAGADRYLLRHETANFKHYSMLHPENQTAKARQQCLRDLKKIGYQVGAGFMVGSPYQTIENIAEDLIFINDLQPQMVGIGPFIPHHATPFSDFPQGSLDMTLFLIGILRLMIPNLLIPATTALGTIDPNGREKGILAGANVVMPNLSPVKVRKQYLLYDNKICTGEEAAECRFCLANRMKKIGYELAVDRGDFVPLEK
ncbi:iron-only hydrogenase maturation protein HydE [Clostridium sp. USBA 49]|jgi:biotin synthase|uniref:[FeFe] hydrogenase H-cluster radical SAM maturase HydE n=1 Tax=Clostridium TaxID=1485 RepID=UPI0009990A30|nr:MULTISPECIES: [FeFe] hydrogenase H-cluster radical SAM maturase HydE [Clostridium]SKA90288.1 iron-only hydrogenase maturation protein HydE [Clostridium sp. USBA 49]